MYESHFGISGPPFQLSPDPSFYFASRGHDSAFATLQRGLEAASGFVVLSGEIGAGKTLLVRRLLGGLDPARVRAVQIVNTQLDADELQQAIRTAFGVGRPDDSLGAPIQRELQDYFAGLAERGCRALLIVDEAQNLEIEAFLLLHELCAAEGAGSSPLQCFLVGQPELRGLLASTPLAALAERVRGSFHLGPLAAEEIRAYIEHRLRKVGWSGRPSFEADAFVEIFRSTAGVPRLINLLCNRLMLSRFLSAKTLVDAELVRRTAEDLRIETGLTAPPLPAAQESSLAAPAARPDAAPAPAARLDLSPAPLLVALRPRRHDAPARPAPGERGPLLCVAAGQADHIKCAPLLRALAASNALPPARLVRTLDNDAFELHRALFAGLVDCGQRFELGVAADSSVQQTAQVMQRLEPIVEKYRPSAVLVIGNSNSALAASLVAGSKKVPLVHIGAGLPGCDGTDAEEANRSLIDRLAALLFTSETQGNELLALEGIAVERVHCVGNLLIDALLMALRAAIDGAGTLRPAATREDFVRGKHGYGLVVMHRTHNLENFKVLAAIISIVREVSRDLPLVWPMHAGVEARIGEYGLEALLAGERIACLPAQPYVELAGLLGNASCVLTDSWSVQEEATALGVPCLALGECGERPITVETGSNTVIGRNTTLATRTVWDVIYNGGKRGRVPALWDGQTAPRIAERLDAWLARPYASATQAERVWPAPVV